MRIFISFIFVLFCFLSGCDMPKDPDNTFQRIDETKVIRAGASHNPPWISLQHDKPSGIEVELLEKLASQLNASIQWKTGTEHDLVMALKENKLDVVLAGFRKESPWHKDISLTKPYFTLNKEEFVWALPQGENRWLMYVEMFFENNKNLISSMVYKRVN